MAAKKQGSTGNEAGAQQASAGGEQGAGARKRRGAAGSGEHELSGAAAAATQGGGSATSRRGASAKEGSTGAKAGGTSSGGKKGGGAGSTKVTAGTGAKGAAAETGTSAPKKRAAGAGAKKQQGGSDLRADMREFAAARPGGWDHHDWVTFLGGLRDKGHDTSDADEIGRQLERERISLVLQDVPGLGPRKVEAVADRFGRLYELRNASVDEIAGVPGVNRDLAEKISNAVR